jgi:hypothetical protein
LSLGKLISGLSSHSIFSEKNRFFRLKMKRKNNKTLNKIGTEITLDRPEKI